MRAESQVQIKNRIKRVNSLENDTITVFYFLVLDIWVFILTHSKKYLKKTLRKNNKMFRMEFISRAGLFNTMMHKLPDIRLVYCQVQ